MLVLLPPSEGKAASGDGVPVALDRLSLPGLTAARGEVLDALVGLCRGDEDTAAEVLGLSPGLRGEIARNAGLPAAGARPAGEVYTGVLFDNLGLATLDAAAYGRAERSLLVFSGLWGAVRISDRIPPYRCSMGVKLPGPGALGAYWRGAMASVLPEVADGLVLDLRSSAYATAWKPAGGWPPGRRPSGCSRSATASARSSATSTRRPRGAWCGTCWSRGSNRRRRASCWTRCGAWGTGWRLAAEGTARKPWQLDVVVTEVH